MSVLLDEPSLRFSIRTSRSNTSRVERPAVMHRRMRVAHVLYRWSRCGMELQLASQWGCFDSRRFSGWIASSRTPEPLTPRLPSSMSVRAFDGAQRDFTRWLTSQLRITATSVVHARGLWMLGPALRAARDAGELPVLLSFHGFDDATVAAPAWRRGIWRRQLQQCAEIVAVSHAARDALARRLAIPLERIHVIHNGVDPRQYQRTQTTVAARAALGLDIHRPVLLCVGSLLPVKGYDLLLDALDTISTPVQVVFVGTDYLAGRLQRRAAEWRHVTARFTGAVNEVKSYYEAADALIAPSRSEGMSNVILEAMAAGLPVIATNVGGNPELVIDGHTGWLTPPNDTAALSTAISNCLVAPGEAARRGANGAARARGQFSLDTAVEQYARLYGRMLRRDHSEQPAVAMPRLSNATTGHPLLADPLVRWYAYGRAAWWHLLVALDAGPGDNVVLPDLLCDVMVAPLHALGIKPRYYRCDPMKPLTAGDISQQADARTRAVLAVHYFGLPQPVADAAAYCRRRAIPFIEDAAHGDLSLDAGQPLGADADAVIYSLRKTHTLPNGAALRIRARSLRQRLDVCIPAWPAAHRDRLRFHAKRMDRRLFGGALERFVDAYRAGRSHATMTSDRDTLSNCLVQSCRELPSLLANLDVHAAAESRREAFHRLALNWKRESWPGMPLIERLQTGWVPYAFPMKPLKMTVDALRDQLSAAGLSAEIWPRMAADAPYGVTDRRWVLVGLNSRQ